MNMGKFRPKKQRQKVNLIVLFTMLTFIALGVAFIIIGFGTSVLTWMATMGIVIVALLSPAIVYVIFKLINTKIEGM